MNIGPEVVFTNENPHSVLEKTKHKIAHYLADEGFTPVELTEEFVAQMHKYQIIADNEIVFAMHNEPIEQSEYLDKVSLELDQFNTSEINIRWYEDINSFYVIILSPKIN